jgi:arabinogalactan endo-1,4-beta-galactosidase
MKTLKIFSLLCLSLSSLVAHPTDKYLGGDISLLPEYQNAGAKYKDNSGTAVEPLQLFKDQQLNTMRVRLFVDPSKYTGSDKDANACQDLEYVKALALQIKEAGFKLLLDFHYSDTWADPVKQWTPADWVGLSDEELYSKIYTYTADVLQQLIDEGVTPDLIQTGNEISYGMLWGPWNASSSELRKCYVNSSANWDYFINLLYQAGKACREKCPNAKIIIHSERVANTSVLTQYFDRLTAAGLDFDVIGLSYYPYFHGNLNTLNNAITSLEGKNYGKEIMVVEAGYPYAWEVPGTTYNYSSTYPYSEEGQRKFTADLVDTLNAHSSVTGLFWWWMEYNAYSTTLSGWYNAPLFDSRNGKALAALYELKNFLPETSAPTIASGSSDADSCTYYRLDGTPVANPTTPGIYIRNHKKVVITHN